MNPWLALSVFLVSFLYDVFYVIFVRFLVRNQKLGAALFSGLMQALIVYEVIMYGKENTQYAIPTIIGAIVGTPVAMWLDEKLPKPRPRNKKGQFKEHLPISNAPAEIKQV